MSIYLRSDSPGSMADPMLGERLLPALFPDDRVVDRFRIHM